MRAAVRPPACLWRQVATKPGSTNGKPGSGVYSINIEDRGAKPKVERLLMKYRKNGALQNVWEHTY